MIKPFIDRFGKPHYTEEGAATHRRAYYAILIKDGKVLLTALPRFDLFEFPGGGLNRGEDYKTCLKREFYEETGYEFELGKGKAQIHQLVNFFADDIRPSGEFWIYDQTYIVYEADSFGVELKEGSWRTPENGTAKWVDLEELKAGKIEINYCHRLAFESYLKLNSQNG